MKGLVPGLVVGAALADPIAAQAADIFNGLRGPTNWQLDLRSSYAEGKKPTHSARLKYWDDHAWMVALRDSSGNTAIGGGPVTQLENDHGQLGLLSYASITKTGWENTVDPYEFNIGTLGTLLDHDGNREISFSGNYNATTGTYSGGVIAGREFGEHSRGAFGGNWDGEELQPQVSGRFSRGKGHIETKVLHTSKGFEAEIFGRINLGKKP